jgi:predicted nucleotidyltransferase
MNVLIEAARQVQQFLLHRNWRFCIIGGLSVIRWGEPQATQDVDISLLTGFGDEQSYIEEILGRFPARISDADRFALENRVLLVRATNQVAIDIALAGIPFEQRMIDRASPFAFDSGDPLITCSAEDLVILKAFAGRDKDWTAVEGVLIRQRDRLDWNYINEHLPPLCELKQDPTILARLARLREHAEP